MDNATGTAPLGSGRRPTSTVNRGLSGREWSRAHLRVGQHHDAIAVPRTAPVGDEVDQIGPTLARSGPVEANAGLTGRRVTALSDALGIGIPCLPIGQDHA